MDNFSFLSNADPNWIEEQFRKYQQDPESVEAGWRSFFEGFEFARKNFEEGSGEIPEKVQKEFKVQNLINGYRSRGHLFTKTNPVRERRKYRPTLAIENFDLEEGDLDTEFEAGSEIGIGRAKLRDIIAHLKETYCRSIGVEYRYIRDPEKIQWLQERMEGTRNYPSLNIDEKKHLLHKLNQAVVFEKFLQKRFPGQKRFSLEGAESLIPALDTVIEDGASLGVNEFVVGMAHRGRLNVLANIFQKTYSDIFSEFEPKDYEESLFDGDVKYHLGYTSDVQTDGGNEVQMTLAPNPSHLESVDPVVEGIARAKIDRRFEGDESRVTPILIHGDAAIAAQGVVYEVIQMSQLKGYRTGGTIHLVINNQVGFTTNYIDGRSSTYCTDVGKTTLCPVFHVNGDDVEALVHTIKIAMDYRQRYHQDVFIDLLCYRKHGHNEGDEPKFTQPLLYKAIAEHPDPREIYYNKLMESGEVEQGIAQEMEEEFKELLQNKLEEAKDIEKMHITSFVRDEWENNERSTPEDFIESPDTSVDKKTIEEVGEKITSTPEGMKFFRKLEKLLKSRKKMLEEDQLDWGLCELLAYGTLVREGFPVRLTGQDSERGTFSHRHAVVKQEDSDEEYVHLSHLGENQAPFKIYNSPLSEYGVLGFDYGYSLVTPDTLTIWEAQFGDFCNGGQVVIDQYISSAEDKWKSMSGITLFLPHGYEGMGAEHSSARMERFLNLASEENMQIVNCTTPANFFHVLRRQLKRKFRKPLVIFTPKSLLRHPRVVSKVEDLTNDRFKELIDDPNANPKKVKKIAFCHGKIYYELLEKKEELEVADIALVRIEQIYPFPMAQVKELLQRYKKAEEYLWVQEEPENMGPWGFLLREVVPEVPMERISRESSASPASGSPKRFEDRQKRIIEEVFKDHLHEQKATAKAETRT
ncbi:MAG: 2-oxoglutarate dehydrogenase E1 component [Flavobacteriales bacterium]